MMLVEDIEELADALTTKLFDRLDKEDCPHREIRMSKGECGGCKFQVAEDMIMLAIMIALGKG